MVSERSRWVCLILASICGFVFVSLGGCARPAKRLEQADRTAYRIIAQEQEKALGRTEPFTIKRPSETFREKLLRLQHLPYSHPGSLGVGHLSPPAGWPNIEYPQAADLEQVRPPWQGDSPLVLSQLEALQIGARNSQEYQTVKEEVFQAALGLDLERQKFRQTLTGFLSSQASADLRGESTVGGVESSGSATLEKRFQNGFALAGRLGLDLVKLLTLGQTSSLGIFADATIALPLLRGAGREVVAEPMTQAERNVVYAIYRFERFKRSFAVQVITDYLTVLQQLDEVANTRENYRNLQLNERRARRLAEAGRLPEIQVDQAVQDALRARDRWLRASQSYNSLLDGFKVSLGLPPDARLQLRSEELLILAGAAAMVPEADAAGGESTAGAGSPLWPEERAATAIGGRLLTLDRALALALKRRLDLRTEQGRVYDAQRQVVVAVDGLQPEMNLKGRTEIGEARSLASADLANGRLRPEKGFFSALLELDWPTDKTAERNLFRNSLIRLEQAVRTLQAKEDEVKLQVRNGWRDLAEARERIRIQARALEVAERRAANTNLLLQAGRVQMRDLLEAQEALVSARNSLTAAKVAYRSAELALLRDLGTLEIDHAGLPPQTATETSHAGEDTGRV